MFAPDVVKKKLYLIIFFYLEVANYEDQNSIQSYIKKKRLTPL